MNRAVNVAERGLFWALAVAAFVACAAGLGARAIDRVAVAQDAHQRNYAIVRVIAPEGPGGMEAAVGILRRARHVASAAQITPEQAAALLSAETGETVAPEDMPPLRLIELELAPEPGAEDPIGDVRAALAQGGVTAEVLQSPGAAAPQSWVTGIRQAALWGAAGLAAGMVLVILFAARGFAARRRDEIHVLADLGASRGKAVARVSDEAALSGFWAGVTGAVVAALAGFALTLAFFPGADLSDITRLFAPIDAAPLAAAPVLAAIAAGMGARRAAESFYDQASRQA